MCFDFFAPSILPPTPRARKYVFNLKALDPRVFRSDKTVLRHAQVLVITLFSASFGAFNDAICALILYMAYSQVSYSGLIFYIIMTSFDIIQTLCLFGKAGQNGVKVFSGKSTVTNFKMTMILLTVVYQSVGVILVFYAYREFKYIHRFMADTLVPARGQ